MRTSRARNSDVPSRAGGVTLLELLVVMALMGLIAAMAVPMFGSGVSSTELKSSARQVAAGLRFARSEAVATRSETRMWLDLEKRAFRVDHDPRQHNLPAGLEMKLFTAQNDIADEKVGSIRFYPDGGSNGGRVTLAAGERTFEIDVDWLTGRVAILD